MRKNLNPFFFLVLLFLLLGISPNLWGSEDLHKKLNKVFLEMESDFDESALKALKEITRDYKASDIDDYIRKNSQQVIKTTFQFLEKRYEPLYPVNEKTRPELAFLLSKKIFEMQPPLNEWNDRKLLCSFTHFLLTKNSIGSESHFPQRRPVGSYHFDQASYFYYFLQLLSLWHSRYGELSNQSVLHLCKVKELDFELSELSKNWLSPSIQDLVEFYEGLKKNASFEAKYLPTQAMVENESELETTAIKNEQFTQDRSMNLYLYFFLMEFNDLLDTPKRIHFIDLGAGKGQAMKDLAEKFESRGKSHFITAIGKTDLGQLKNFQNGKTPVKIFEQFFESISPDKLLIQTDPPIEEIVIFDVFGVFSYSKKIDVVLRNLMVLASKQKVPIHYHVLGSNRIEYDRILSSKSRSLTLREWIALLPGIELKENSPKNVLDIIIHPKKETEIKVPQLKIVDFYDFTPPTRFFREVAVDEENQEVKGCESLDFLPQQQVPVLPSKKLLDPKDPWIRAFFSEYLQEAI